MTIITLLYEIMTIVSYERNTFLRNFIIRCINTCIHTVNYKNIHTLLIVNFKQLLLADINC